MAVIIRLRRKGNKHRPFYHLVAIDSRKKLSGLFLEQLGTYDPMGETCLRLDRPAVDRWLAQGADISKTAKQLIRRDDAQPVVSVTRRPVSATAPGVAAVAVAAAAPAAPVASAP